MAGSTSTSLRYRSTLDRLTELIGRKPPDALAKTLERFHRYLMTTPGLELWDLVCFELVKEPFRDDRTPPEVFPFAELRVDGVHLGWVDRAPELCQDDFAVARVAPMDPEPVSEIASSIQQAFVIEMSLWAENDHADHAADVARVRAAAAAMDLPIIPNASRLVYGMESTARPVSVTVPEGYHFAPAADSVGVLAPAGAFPLKEEHDLMLTAGWPEENVSRLAADLVERFPATALFHFKCLWWKRAPAELWAEGMKRAYLQLDRPSLAANVLAG